LPDHANRENEMSQMKQIVVGVDGSDCSRRALSWAHAEALEHGAELVVLTTWRLQNMSAASAGGIYVAEPDLQPETLAETVLADALRELPQDLAVTLRHEVIEGNAAKTLIEWSSAADLVVVGSRGHGGFAGMLLGSVSQHLVSHASCTVVVVR
jgi:nucleotide-binding universal stress UspA family protein